MRLPSRSSITTAAASLLVFWICCAGFICEFGPELTRVDPTLERSWRVNFRAGRVACWIETEQLATGNTFRPPGWHLDWRFRFKRPDLRRAVWEWDFHYVTRSPGDTISLVAFPIWCMLIPSLIAPILWLLRRPRAQPQGFEISSPSVS